jgi:hypothetical protein
MTQPERCTAYPFMNEPLAVETPSALMCQDLVRWQATSPTTPSLDLDAVLAAAKPLLADRFAWSVHFTGDGSKDFPVAQNICVLHISGASLSTVVPNYPTGLGEALAGLLGLRVDAVGDAAAHAAAADELDRIIEASKPVKAKAKAKAEAEPLPEPAAVVPVPETDSVPELDGFADESNDGDEPLSESDQQTCLLMLKALPADARRKFTISFRSHFEVDENVKAVGGCIVQRKHQLFVQDFIDEVELQGGA